MKFQKMFAFGLLALVVSASQSSHAETRNENRILWGGSHGDEKSAKELMKILKDVPGIDEKSDAVEDESSLTLHGIRCESKSECKVRTSFHGKWKAIAESDVKELYRFLRDEGDLKKSFDVGSIFCTKSRTTFSKGTFCDIEFVEE